MSGKGGVNMKNIKLTASEIRSIFYYLESNPCESGCAYPEMNNSRKNCDECKLTKDKESIMKKLNLI